MLTDYIREAIRLAHYELMETGRFFATIPPLEGLWTEGATLEESREELQSTLEDWLLLGLQLGHEIPVIAGIESSKKRTSIPTNGSA
jgi:predicted RNase H-like HicB family nuclease